MEQQESSSLNQSRLLQYEQSHRRFIAVLDNLQSQGETRVAMPSRLDKSEKCPSIEYLRELENDHISAIFNPGNTGYIPTHLYCNLVAIHNFTSYKSRQFFDAVMTSVEGYKEAGFPPFRQEPRYEVIAGKERLNYGMFPSDDFILEFGAGEYFFRAQKRTDAGILPVTPATVQKFCDRSLTDDGLDPVVLRHLVRHAETNFNYHLDGGENPLVSMAQILAGKLISTERTAGLPGSSKVPTDPLDCIDLMMKWPMWYQRIADSDRMTIAASYRTLPNLRDYPMTGKVHFEAVYRAASLIIPELPTPDILWEEFKQRRQLEQVSLSSVELDSTLEAMRAGDFSGISQKLLKAPGAEERMAALLKDLIADLEPGSMDTIVLGKAIFGPPACILLSLRPASRAEKPNLISRPLIKKAIGEARIQLVEKISNQQLTETRDSFLQNVGTVRKKIGSISGTAEYKAYMKTRLARIER